MRLPTDYNFTRQNMAPQHRGGPAAVGGLMGAAQPPTHVRVPISTLVSLLLAEAPTAVRPRQPAATGIMRQSPSPGITLPQTVSGVPSPVPAMPPGGWRDTVVGPIPGLPSRPPPTVSSLSNTFDQRRRTPTVSSLSSMFAQRRRAPTLGRYTNF